MTDYEQTRFDGVVETVTSVIFGVLAFFLVGSEVFVWTVLFLPILAPVVLGVAVLGSVWLLRMSRRTAKGFGLGMIIGWVLLAFWTSGASVGVFP